jgi:hypothetical protein
MDRQNQLLRHHALRRRLLQGLLIAATLELFPIMLPQHACCSATSCVNHTEMTAITEMNHTEMSHFPTLPTLPKT